MSNIYLATLNADQFFHIYNRTNNQEALFKSEENRAYFLQKYAHYLHPYLKTYAYCLLHNHFHLLVKIRPEEAIIQTILNIPIEQLSKYQENVLLSLKNKKNTHSKIPEPFSIHEIVSKQFRRFFLSYAKAFNKENSRQGNLFNRPFKRLLVDNDNYFNQLLYYIHANPSLHNVHNDFTNYPWSSYQTHLSDKPTLIERDIVLDWFGNKNEYKKYHAEHQNLMPIKKWIIEN